jgi:hypothetical protein
MLLILIFAGSGSSVQASLSKKQARKLISRIAGSELPGSAVRLKTLTENNHHAEATAEIETAFRLAQNDLNEWKVVEIRMGPGRWEDISLLSAGSDGSEGKCNAHEIRGANSSGPLSSKRARCLIAKLLKIELPSDAVRIRSISSLGLPFASSSSALVVALVEIDFRFTRETGNWRVSDVRAGRSDWVNVEASVAALQAEKRERARQDLLTVAQALEAFRRDQGFYISSEKHTILIDHLNPRYLSSVIRLDPWHKPYRYRGERDHFQVSSDGPDGKENTPDDLVVSGTGRPAS